MRLLSAFGIAAIALSACSQNAVVPGGSGPHGLPLPHVDIESARTDSARQIALATTRFIDFHGSENSTRNIFGAPGERACVATVQAIVRDAGLPFIGPTTGRDQPIVEVDKFRAALVADRKHWRRMTGKELSLHSGAGDIWIQGDGHAGGNSGQNHVGICQDAGCRHIVSNSSADGAFTWTAAADRYATYYAALGYPLLAGAVYHHR